MNIDNLIKQNYKSGEGATAPPYTFYQVNPSAIAFTKHMTLTIVINILKSTHKQLCTVHKKYLLVQNRCGTHQDSFVKLSAQASNCFLAA